MAKQDISHTLDASDRLLARLVRSASFARGLGGIGMGGVLALSKDPAFYVVGVVFVALGVGNILAAIGKRIDGKATMQDR